MKRFIAVLALLIIGASACFSAVFPNSFRASVSLGGRDDGMLQTSLSLAAAPFHFNFMTPFVLGTAYVQLSDTKLEFGGLRAGLGFDIMYIKDHPFAFLSANPTVWSPSIAGGIDYEDKALRGFIEISLFRFMEKDAIYEYMVPFCDLSESGIDRIGVLVFRFSGLF